MRDPLTLSLHSLTLLYSLSHSLVHSLCSLAYPLAHTHLPSHPPVHSLTHSLTLFHTLAYPRTSLSFTRPITHSITDPDGDVAERNIWDGNDLRPSEYGPIELYGLHSVQDMTITNNYAGGTQNGHQSTIGIQGGGSTPSNGTGVTNLHCSNNHPPANCKSGIHVY